MDAITIPEPVALEQRIFDCETELRSLRRLLRMARALERANQARRRRIQPPPEKEGHADAR